MFKNIKKSFKYFIIILGVIIMLPTVFYLALQISEVQTFMVKRVTRSLSNNINSTISVGSIDYKFFNNLIINDLIIKDQNNDTLLYSSKISVVIKRLDIRNSDFRLGRVTIMKPVVKIITDSTGITNLSWYLNMLKSSSDTTNKTQAHFSVDQIDISSAKFTLSNYTDTVSNSRLDYNNIRLSGIGGIIEDLNIQSDSVTFNIYNLGFREYSGFLMRRMSSSVTFARGNILFKSLFMNCDSSILNFTKLGFYADSAGSFKKFTEEVKLDIIAEKSLINSSDLQYFISGIEGINESVTFSGKIAGTIAELRGRNIELLYGDYTHLKCDFDFSGLPKIENTFIYIGVNSLKTNAKDFRNIKLHEKDTLIVPDILNKLGNVFFDGTFTGFTTDFVTYGKFSTNLGNISTDISLRPEESKKYRIKGLLTGSDIDIGMLTGQTELLGKLSMQTNIDGYANSYKKFAGNLTGKVDSIEVNRYIYRNISLNGSFTEKTWDGSINIDDKNIKLDLLGLLNFEKKLPEFDFTLNVSDANLFKLNIDKLDTSSSVTMLLTSNFRGNTIDNLDGEIKLLNSNFKKYNEKLELYDFSIKTHLENSKPVLSLRTDFIDADIIGYYNFAAIGTLVKSTLSTLMPAQFEMPVQRNELKKNNFTFDIRFKNTDKINTFFRTGLILSDKSYISGAVVPDSAIRIRARAKLLTFKGMSFNDLAIEENISGYELNVNINSSSLLLLKQSELKSFAVNLKTKPDNFIFTVDWDNKNSQLNNGKFIARGVIAKNTEKKGNATLRIDIDSSDIYSGNTRWKISQSSILIDSNAIKANKLYISSKDRYYLVDGSISNNPDDTLHLEFKGIDIAPLNYLVTKNNTDPNTIPLDFKGNINGKILVTNVYKNLLLESNIIVNDFSLLGSEFGNISVISAWDISKKVVQINASNNLKSIKMFDIAGIYDPSTSKLDLTANTAKLPIGFLNPLLKVFASDINGYASGKVKFHAEPGKMSLLGAVLAEDASLKINYLQTRFRLTDTIRMDKEGFKFNNIKLADEKGNNAILAGAVYHKNMQDYSADLIINMNTNECLILNTRAKDNPLFYGTAYATGVTTIKSGPNTLAFDISAKSGKNTKISIPLNNGLSVSEYSFITFVDSDSSKKTESGQNSIRPAPATPNKTGMDLNIDLEVTPDAEVQLIFDSKSGDIMKGHGSGQLNLNLNKKGDFKMSGDYIIEEGDYLFTLGNFLNKSFRVENGGKIMFNGDVYNAEIDIKAIYRLKASLYEILQDDSENYKERIPVECQLNLSGKLFNPIVGFNIYLPTADERTRTSLRNAISTEEELSRQFAYLLVMNSFYTNTSRSSATSSTAIAGTSAMAVTTTEMLSNQLSNWLSQISNDFDLDFNYRPGYSSINPQEVQVALSTQLLNDKAVINSNLDVRGTSNGNNTNTAPITGDFDVEYKITEKIRFKVFNRFNNPATGRTEPYTQGIGIFFKQDFNKFSDLFRRRNKSEMKKRKRFR